MKNTQGTEKNEVTVEFSLNYCQNQSNNEEFAV